MREVWCGCEVVSAGGWMGRDSSLASDPAGVSLVWCCGVLGYGQSLGTLTARIEMKPERITRRC